MKEIKLKAMKNEKDVKINIRRVLDSYDLQYHFMPPANGFGRSGIPDIVGCYNGFFFAVEAKFGYNKPSNNQVREIDAIGAAKGAVWVVNDANIEDWQKLFGGWVALCS